MRGRGGQLPAGRAVSGCGRKGSAGAAAAFAHESSPDLGRACPPCPPCPAGKTVPSRVRAGGCSWGGLSSLVCTQRAHSVAEKSGVLDEGCMFGVQPLRTPQSHLSLPTRPFPCGTSSGAHSLLQAPVRPGTRVAGVETPVPNLLAWVSGLFSTELEFSQPWLASPASRTGVESGEGEKGAARRTKGSNLTLAPSPCVQPRGGTTEATDPTDVTKGFRLQSLPPPPGPRFVLFVDFSAPPKAGTPGAISFLPLRSLPGVSTAP